MRVADIAADVVCHTRDEYALPENNELLFTHVVKMLFMNDLRL
jgi:hypothetical protein